MAQPGWPRRGQSTTIGLLLLTAVVILAVAMFGILVFGNVTTAAETTQPPADVMVDVTFDTIVVTHAGGAPIRESDLELRLRGDTERTYTLGTDAFDRRGDGDRRFEAGETATFSHSASGDVAVLIVDTASNRLILQVDRSVPDGPADQPARFDLTVDNTNAPLEAGETLEVRATVENTGDRPGTQTISLDISDGVGQTDTRSLKLAGGQSEQITLTWNTAVSDAGNYSVNVSSADDWDSTDVRVRTPSNYEVTITGTNSPVTEGNNLTVDATITNLGEEPGLQTVTLDVSGQSNPADEIAVGLLGGNSTSIRAIWQTEPGDGGPGRSAEMYTVTVSSNQNTDSVSVEVEGSTGGGPGSGPGGGSGGGPGGGGPP